MEINGTTRTCGVFGNPVEHTMSPAIHNTLARETGINLVYVPFHVENDKVGDAVRGAYALNLLGCNVTVPHKMAVIPYLSEMDDLAQKIGAVNTLVRTETGYKGYNTDMPGLYRAMTEDGIRIEGERIIILGAGGVARAVALLLGEKKAEELIILNRTEEKARAIAEEVNRVSGRNFAKAMKLADYTKLPEEKYLCIQATNIGMYPKTDEAVIEDETFYRKIHTGYDLVYRPAVTKFMQLVRDNGGRSCNGLKMLLWQGVIAYELWNNVSITEAQADAAYAAMKKAMGIE